MIKRILKLLFNRTTLCVLFILIQLGYFIRLVMGIGTYNYVSYFIFRLLGILVSFYIVNSDINPSYKTAWVLLILALPIFGVMFYIFFGSDRLFEKARRRMELYTKEERKILRQNKEIMRKNSSLLSPVANQARYLYKRGGYPLYDKTRTVYFSSGEAKFEAMLKELQKARKFIFLEYFIIREGLMWDSVLEILEKKAGEGVDVRVIYDDIGCLLTLPAKYEKKLSKRGIKCKVFNKFKPVISTGLNYRDHRKILIIDGNVAFNGGINLADEYINAYPKHGHWKDSAVMLEGKAVKSFTMMFLTMWDLLSGEKSEDIGKYMPDKYAENARGLVIPFTDSPLCKEAVGENVYLNLINSARKYIYITTPYLVIDNEMQTALSLAAKKGVDVRIITPHIPDKRFVHAVTRAYYGKLAQSGVRIFEYLPGFIHAKNLLCDGTTAVVGTINLDFRSLYLHFECATWLYKTDCVDEIKKDLKETFGKCAEITKNDCNAVNPFVRLVRMFLKLFSPLI